VVEGSGRKSPGPRREGQHVSASTRSSTHGQKKRGSGCLRNFIQERGEPKGGGDIVNEIDSRNRDKKRRLNVEEKEDGPVPREKKGGEPFAKLEGGERWG